MGSRGPKSNKEADALLIEMRGKRKTYQEIGSVLGVSKVRAWARAKRIVNELSTRGTSKK